MGCQCGITLESSSILRLESELAVYSLSVIPLYNLMNRETGACGQMHVRVCVCARMSSVHAAAGGEGGGDGGGGKGKKKKRKRGKREERGKEGGVKGPVLSQDMK